MLGSQPTTANSTASAGPAIQIPTQGLSDTRGTAARSEQSHAFTPWALIGLAVLYVAWALVERHEKVRDSIKPQAIAINLRNLALIALSVILSMNLLKVGLTKLVALKIPLISGAARILLNLVANA